MMEQDEIEGCDLSVCSLISDRNIRRRQRKYRKRRSMSASSSESDSGSEKSAMSDSGGSGHESSGSEGSLRSRPRHRRRHRRRWSRSSRESRDSSSRSSERSTKRGRTKRRGHRKGRRRDRHTSISSDGGGRDSEGSRSRTRSMSRGRDKDRRRERDADAFDCASMRDRWDRPRRDRSWDGSPLRRTQSGLTSVTGPAPERRVYVGGAGLVSVDEEVVADLFNHALVKGLHKDKGSRGHMVPVAAVYLNRAKPFGFVELRTAALATATLQLDGLLRLPGQAPFRIRRPTDYRVPTPGTEPPPLLLDLVALGYKTNNATPTTAIPDVVPDGPAKVFIGGLPYLMTDDDIATMLTAAGGGALRSFRVVKDQTPQATALNAQLGVTGNEEKNRGFAFCEFIDPTCGQRACEALNGLVLPGAGTRVLSLRMGMQPNKVAHAPVMIATTPRPVETQAVEQRVRTSPPLSLSRLPENPLLLLQRLLAANNDKNDNLDMQYAREKESQSTPSASLSSSVHKESSMKMSHLRSSAPASY